MNSYKRSIKLWFLLIVFSIIYTGCASQPAETLNPADNTKEPQATEQPVASEVPVAEDHQNTNNTNQEEILSKLPLDMTEVSSLTKTSKNIDLMYEAEDAILEGGTKKESKQTGYSGSGYVSNFTNAGTDKVTFKINTPEDSYYNLTFYTAAPYGDKLNNVIIDGNFIGELPSKDKNFVPYTFEKVYLNKGEHEITIAHSWGWFLLDALRITSAEAFDTSVFTVSPVLVNKNADDSAKRLMKFLTDVYGKYIISGQYSTNGVISPEFTAIRLETGRYPAMLGLDLIDYTPSRVARGTSSKAVEAGIEYWDKGGIVTYCWHWNAPTKYLPDTAENPWWSGFYTRATNIDLAKIMNGKDQEGYDLLLQDIDAIAAELKRLQDAGVPVLWRPLHEASGGWFWWGNKGPEPFIKLWKLLYERLTYEHKLNNLIWVWNGQGLEWYPGDDYVDILGEDIYPGEKQYGSQYGRFDLALKYTKTKKIIALTENGCLFDPDLAFRDNARWAWFSTWQGDFVVKSNGKYSEQYTEKSMLKKVYEHPRVLSLIDIPDLKNYPLD